MVTAVTMVVSSPSQAVAAPTPANHYPSFSTITDPDVLNTIVAPADGRIATFPVGSPTLTATVISTKDLSTATSAVLPGDRGFGSIYGSSSGFSYITVNSVDTTTTITFSAEVPAGEIGLALGDIDAEELSVSMGNTNGEVFAAQMGVQAPFNYTTSDTSLPTIIFDSSTTITLLEPGCPDAGKCNTSGATAWFKPTVPVSVITIESTRRPSVISASYQIWLANGPAQIVSWAPTDTTLAVADLPITPTPAATTNGGGAISYSVNSSSTSNCSVDSVTAEISATTAGTCVIQAFAEPNGGFLAGSTKVTFTLTVPPPPPPPSPEPTKPPTPTEWNPETTTFQVDTFPSVIDLPPPPNPPGGGSYTFSTHGDSTSLCTVDRDTPTVTVQQPGTCIVTATIGATKNFSKASVTVAFTIASGPMLAATGTPAWPVWPAVAGLVGAAMLVASRVLYSPRHRGTSA